ncbi:M15 family metallopeptidase [Kribbella sp. NPDC003505]|uniref:M15 family metallopeptidase n=1 Tax=Kribbella sp. NPDC003505 TaxID=3154448 RepID=UPI0033BF5318
MTVPQSTVLQSTVLLSDDRITGIPAIECGEPLVDLFTRDMLTSGQQFARETVADRLALAGAAADLTLVGAHGPLDLGTPIDATPEQSSGACFFAAANISREARTNRSLLADVLTAAGLVNYPTQWWHWSFGDRYWAFVEDRPNALYGPAYSLA